MPKNETKNGKSAGPVVVEGQADLLAEWRESGLITDSHYSTFTRREICRQERGK